MGIKDKATYGEYYWATGVEANKIFDEVFEKALSPHIREIFAGIPETSELPSGIRNFIKAISEPPTAGFGDLIKLTGGEFAAEVIKDAVSPAMSMMKRLINRHALETWLTPEQANVLFRQGKIDADYWSLVTESAGYHEIIGKQVYQAQLPYPSIPDLILYSRYHGDADAPYGEIQDWFDVSPRDWPVWKWLSQQRLTTLQVQTLYKRGIIDQQTLYSQLAEIGWSQDDRPLLGELGWLIPNAMLLVQGDLLQEKSTDIILKDIEKAEIHPEYSRKYLDAILTKPSSQDIIAYELRRNPSLTNLENHLRKIGIHDNYFDLYKELAYQIPPVADIITMAVREAFTPEIAQRFGQYEDFPPEFEQWAAKKGLSAEWSKRYWAAHWSLPSPLQGFEMLHRGLIDQSELDMLLRALDIMPFWREKLTGIAYRRLSRVDIRRMYGLGVLTEREVLDSYLELGYNDRDAERMALFTVKQIIASQSKFSSSDVITAFSKYMINASEAHSLLASVGVKPENISYIISTAEYKREWTLTEERITAIKNLYKKGVYNPDKARGELLKLDLPTERVDILMEQWYIDEKDKPTRFWTTAQVLSFAKEGLITQARAIKELTGIGYDTEHINIYMETAKCETPPS